MRRGAPVCGANPARRGALGTIWGYLPTEVGPATYSTNRVEQPSPFRYRHDPDIDIVRLAQIRPTRSQAMGVLYERFRGRVYIQSYL